KQRKAGVIFDWPPRQLAGRFATEFHVHFVAQILNSGAAFILHFADKIDECALGTSGASEHELAAWNLDGDRNKVLRAVQLEVIHFHCDGEVGDRIAQHQSVLELPFFIGCSEFVERLARVIPLAVVQFCRRRFFQGDLDTSEDRKSTRLNSSHEWISYAVFCLKKKIQYN